MTAPQLNPSPIKRRPCSSRPGRVSPVLNGWGTVQVPCRRLLQGVAATRTARQHNDASPRVGASLVENELESTEVTCPWHFARFDRISGGPRCPPAPEGVKAYTVRIVGMAVEVEGG